MLKSKYRQHGLSLIELMVGMVIGLIILGAAFAFYLTTSRSGLDNQRLIRVNQEVRAVMDLMIQDVRRSGYWANAANGGQNPFMIRTTGSATDLFVGNSCFLYTYDATFLPGNVAGAVNAADFFGFRRNGSSIQMLNASSGLADTSANCSGTNTGWWQNLTDSNVVNITNLTVTMTNRCLSIASGETTPPCNTSGDIETRYITIQLTAQHVQDNTINVTLTETALLPNNRLVP